MCRCKVAIAHLEYQQQVTQRLCMSGAMLLIRVFQGGQRCCRKRANNGHLQNSKCRGHNSLPRPAAAPALHPCPLFSAVTKSAASHHISRYPQLKGVAYAQQQGGKGAVVLQCLCQLFRPILTNPAFLYRTGQKGPTAVLITHARAGLRT